LSWNKKTHEDYLQTLKNKNITVVPLEKYIDAKTKIKHKCYCGNEWTVPPNRVLAGRGCGCKGGVQRTHEQYLQALKDKGIEVFPLEKYVTNGTKILHKCTCNKEWKIAPSTVLQGIRCGCIRETQFKTKTHEQYLKELQERKIKVKPLEEYKGDRIKILHECDCGNQWRVVPRLVLQGSRCTLHMHDHAHMFKQWTHEEYLMKLKEKDIQVKPLETYKGYDTPSLHKCICGTEWRTSPSSIFQGSKCGCIKSREELVINKYLTKNNITFIPQQKFKGLKGKRHYLKYDFAIYDKETIICLIEYQGEQHYRFLKHWHKTKEKFIRYQNYDQFKRDYAKQYRIPLIEIRYDQDTIPTLEAELKKLGIGQNVEQLVLF